MYFPKNVYDKSCSTDQKDSNDVNWPWKSIFPTLTETHLAYIAASAA